MIKKPLSLRSATYGELCTAEVKYDGVSGLEMYRNAVIDEINFRDGERGTIQWEYNQSGPMWRAAKRPVFTDKKIKRNDSTHQAG